MTAQLALGVESPAFGDEHDFWSTPAVAIEAIAAQRRGGGTGRESNYGGFEVYEWPWEPRDPTERAPE